MSTESNNLSNDNAKSPIVNDQQYWDNRWLQQATQWDIGYPAPAITTYMNGIDDKDIAILIPGCGNAYEAAYLVQQGFTNITLLDISPIAVNNLQQKFKEHPAVRIICEDFFHHQGAYDIIIEQTFFCAIPIASRITYAAKMHELLTSNGHLIGVLFNRNFDNPFPPYGGNQEAYLPIFEPYFDILKMETCYNSIEPRANTELFINLRKRQ